MPGMRQPKLVKIVLCFILVFLLSNMAFSKSRAYVKDLVPEKGITKETANKIRDIITLTIFEKYGDRYRIVSDDDVKIMFKQAETLMQTGCDAERCIIEIGYSIDADEIIYGTVTSKMGKIYLTMNNLKRDREIDEFSKKAFVKVDFYKSQLDWYASEVAKKLINPKYRVDPSKAPTEMKIELDISDLKLTGIKGLDISVFKFKTTDSTIARIIDYLKELIKSGDNNFKEKNYSSALLEYQKVIEKIETKLTKSKQVKLAKFKVSVDDRIVSSYAMYFKIEIEKADKTAKAGKYENALNDYEEIKKEFNQIKTKYRSKLEYLNTTINKRTDAVYIMKAKYNEKEGDVYYSEYKFEKAIRKYGDALWYMDKIHYKKSLENVKYKKKLIEKEEAANQTGYSYFKNTVQSHCDWIEYYNISEQENKAEDTLGKLRAYISDSNWCDDKEMIKMYNEQAELLKKYKIEPCTKVAGVPGKVRTIGGMEFVYIPTGEFIMGSSDGDADEKPKHKVNVSSFWMSKYEITQKLYQAIMGRNPSEFEGDNNPVEQVSWNEAMEFCEKFSKKYGVKARLPYEAEWEYACRAGTATKYYWGNSMDGSYCWDEDNSGSKTHPVGQKKPNKWGLHDMSGNVWEWCMDWYDENYYSSSPSKNPRGPSICELKVLRGGSWYAPPWDVRSAERRSHNPSGWLISYGFGFRAVVFPK